MNIPTEIKNIIKELQKNKFEAYIVGGCVRDLLLKKEPEDWDIATNAKPEEISKIFSNSFYENNFLTVTVLTKSKKNNLEEVEITTYRAEGKYTDKRHPDEVRFAETLEQDLSRRDFTINSLALELLNNSFKIIDIFDGQKDLKNKILRSVGKADERFSEDALRMMRAVRFATTLDFEIEKETYKAIKNNSELIKNISQERIRDELIKIIMSERAAEGIELLRKLDILKYIIPEIEEGYEVGQNKHHIYSCYEHSLKSLEYAAKKNFNKYVRIAALLHDVAKPRVKQGEGSDSTFYNHEVVGARMTKKILERLKFSKKDIDKLTKLVRYHLFYYNVDEVGENSVRRLVRQAGTENMEELLQLRMADRIGSGVPKAEPYKLRHLKYIIEKVSQDPISAKMLKLKGDEVMKILNLTPGPKIGQVLDILLDYVLEDPKNNKKEFLKNKVKELSKLSDKELKSLAEKAKAKREEIETKRDKMTKNKYWVT